MKYHDRDEYGRKIHIPNMYKVPFIELDENERSEQAQRRKFPKTPSPYPDTPLRAEYSQLTRIAGDIAEIAFLRHR